MAAEMKKKYAYPWAELYDMESRISGTGTRGGRKGRPASLYTRRRTSLMLSDDEVLMLANATAKLGNALHPGSVTKSQVYGLAIRLLDSRLDSLKDRVSSWDDVVRVILEERGD